MPDKILPKSNAQVISSKHKSRPYWEARSPRWISQIMMGRACVPAHGGAYRINKVTEPFIPIGSSVGTAPRDLPSENLHISHSHAEGTKLQPSFAAYDESPKEVELQPIQTVIKMHTRIPALYSTHHNQLEQQINLAAEWIYETREYLMFNHPDYGLLNNVAPKMYIECEDICPPTIDLMDEMLSRAWKAPDFFVAHPEAIHAFCGHCNRLGLQLDTVTLFGVGGFAAWRGVPIIPTNKILLQSGGEGGDFEDIKPLKNRTHLLLMSVGADKQGVVSLFAAGQEGSPKYPFVTVDFMGMADDSVASYLMTTYAAMAVLTDEALCCAEVTV